MSHPFVLAHPTPLPSEESPPMSGCHRVAARESATPSIIPLPTALPAPPPLPRLMLLESLGALTESMLPPGARKLHHTEDARPTVRAAPRSRLRAMPPSTPPSYLPPTLESVA